MGWKSIFDTGPCTLAVSTSAGNVPGVITATPLWTGTLGKGAAISFADQPGWVNTQLTLSVDANGNVSLVGDLGDPSGSGRKYYVKITPSVKPTKPLRIGAWSDGATIIAPFGIVDLVLDAGASVVALGGEAVPYEFPSEPANDFGFLTGFNGF